MKRLFLTASILLLSFAALSQSTTTFYVRTDGSDSNSCTVDSAAPPGSTAGACLTVQAAIDKVYGNIVTQFFTNNIFVRGGTYASSCNQLTGLLVGGGTLNITGDISTPATVNLSCSTTHVFRTTGAQVNLNGFKLSTPSGTGSPVFATNGSNLVITNMEYGVAAAAQVEAETNSTIMEYGPITISAGTVSHFHVNNASTIVSTAAYTLTGTPHWGSYYAGVASYGSLFTGAATFSGLATGTRCVVHDFGYVNVSGASGGANFLPGDLPCEINEMGVYLDEANRDGTYNTIGILDYKNHLRGVGAAPLITSCGTSPGIIGTHLAGTIITGTGAPTACTVTFVPPYNNTPSCIITWQYPQAVHQYGVSPAGITITQTGASNAFIDYHCIAQPGG